MTKAEKDQGKTITLPDGTKARQPRLLPAWPPGRGQREALTPPPITPFPGELSGESSLALALSWFEQEMARLGYAENTQDNYLVGLKRLVRFLGRGRQVQDIQPYDVKRFKAWLQDQPRAAKTKELTVTAVRTFFKTVVDADILPTNPARDVYPVKAESPLPTVLYDAEADALRRTAAQMATRTEDPDPTPALLVLLFLDVGLRLGEVTRLKIQDVDLSNRLRPVVHVRYQNGRHRAKRRKLIAPPDLTPLLQTYVDQRADDSAQLLPWSGRHIRNMVTELGRDAGLHRSVNPSSLRWTFALGQWKAGVPDTTLQGRLGLSEQGWLDVKQVLEDLARQPV